MRKILAKAMRKMQTPEYCPVVSGAKDFVQSSVVVEVKNTMFICSMSIAIELELEVDMGMELPVEVAISIVIELISIL